MKERQGQVTRRNLVAGVGEGILATPWVFFSLPGGFLMTALLTQYFGVPLSVFGWIVALPALANALQVFYLPLVAYFMRPRDMALALGWMNLGFWTLFALSLPLLPVDDSQATGVFFLVFFALVSFSGSLMGVGWNAWVRGWIPGRIRGQYMGRRNLYIQATTVGFLLFTLLLLSRAEAGVWPFQVLIFTGALMRFFSLMWQHLIVEKRTATASSNGAGWFSNLSAAWMHRPLRLYLFFMAWWAFWMSAMGPFSIVYAFSYLDVSEAMFARLTILATTAGGLTMPFWGRCLDRYGCTRVLAMSVILWWSTGYLWAILTPDTAWVLYFSWLFGGAVAGGFLIGGFTLLYRVLPEGLNTAGVSLNIGVTSAAAAMGPILVGRFLGWLGPDGDLTGLFYRALFVLATTMILLGAFFARRIPEPSSGGAQLPVLGAMRALRNSMTQLGLGFATNTHQVAEAEQKRMPDEVAENEED